MSILGTNIKKLRTNSGLTQAQLGEKLGLAESTVSLYESGKREPDNKTLINIADFFGVTTDSLLGRTKTETIAAHRTDDPTSPLPEEARKSIEDFKRFIFEKYGIKYN